MIEQLRIFGQQIRVDYREGSGIPLLICNGWGANLETLNPLVDALDNRSILRFDVPGVGGSPCPRMPLRISQIAAIAEQLCQHYALTRIDLAGFSWGGLLAQEIAKRNPRLVRRLILLATSSGHIMVPADPRILLAFKHPQWITSLVRPSKFFEREFLCRVGPALFGGDALRQNPMSLLPLLRLLKQPSARAMLWQVAGTIGWTSLPWLSRLTQPCLIIAGKQDRVINPLNPMLLKRLIRNARLEWIDGGHLFPVLDAPQLTALHMLAFLDEHPKVIPLEGRRKQPTRRAS